MSGSSAYQVPVKLKLCRYHTNGDVCMHGDSCRFAHGEQELRRRAQERTQQERDQWHYEVFRKHNKDRTDVSFFLCHFTKSTGPLNKQTVHDIKGFAHERFKAILTEREVHDCALPHLHLDDPVRAVCFTEMMLPSLSMHAENYSPWGIAFYKSFLFNNTMANPVHYCRKELFDSLKEGAKGNHDQLRYMTPFNPKYWDQLGQEARIIDYSHEREWRTPGPVSFELENLAYVFVPDIRLFKELMPDLHEELFKKCVEIRVIEKVVDTKSCQRGYGCSHGLQCDHVHTKDEKDVFRFWAGLCPAGEASERRGPEEASGRSGPEEASGRSGPEEASRRRGPEEESWRPSP